MSIFPIAQGFLKNFACKMSLSPPGVQNTPVWCGVSGYFYAKPFQDWSPDFLTGDTILEYGRLAGTSLHASLIGAQIDDRCAATKFSTVLDLGMVLGISKTVFF
jgi:hypothetical protein